MVKINNNESFDEGEFKRLSSKEQFDLIMDFYDQGKFGLIPHNVLTEENITLGQKDIRTVLHQIAHAFMGYLLPPHLLTEKILSTRAVGVTEGHPWVGKRLIDTIADHLQIKHVPKEKLTQNLLESINDQGESLLHILAKTKQFEYVPKDRLSPHNIRLKDKEGKTVLDLLTEDQLSLIPGRFLTHEDLVKRTNSEDTLLQNYIRRDKIHEINPNLLTKETLLLENPSGVTCFMTAIAYGYYQCIPEALFTEENILKETIEGENCLDLCYKNLIHADKKEDKQHYLDCCLKLVKPLPSSYIKTLEDRLKRKYDPRWKEAWNFLQTLIKTEKARRTRDKIGAWVKEEIDMPIDL